MHDIDLVSMLMPMVQNEAYVAKYIQYLHLLEKWNQVYNLTAIKGLDNMAIYHILDSWMVRPYIQGPRILDVGTGAGLPGIVLAIAYPEHHFSLLDSQVKRIRFLETVRRELSLTNVEIVHARIEDYNPASPYNTVVSRAMTNISSLVDATPHCIAEDGIWIAMKNHDTVHKELINLPLPYTIYPYRIPGIVEQKVIVVVRRG